MSDTHVTPEDLYEISTLSEPRFSPDGRWLAYVNTQIDRESDSYRSAIWLAPAAGGRPRRFTSGEKRDSAPRWSPDGRWLAFVSDRGGEKAKAQIYVIATDGGEALRLTKMDNGAGEPAWSPDGKRLAFTSRLDPDEMAAESEQEPPRDPEQARRQAEEKEKKEKEKGDPRLIRRFAYRAETSYFDGRTSHLYVLDFDPETAQAADRPRRLTEDERDYRDPHWLPDGSALVAVAHRHPDQDDLFYHPDIVRLPLDGSAPEILTTAETDDTAPRPSPDGQWIAYSSLPAAELTSANVEIKLLPARGRGEPRVLTTALDAHADEPRWTADSRGICFLTPRGGRVELCRVSVDGGPIETLLSGEREIMAFDLAPGGGRAGMVVSTDRAPWDLYVAGLEDAEEKRLTEVNAAWLAGKTLGEVEDLWYESHDGTRIHGWLIKPPDYQPGTRLPLALSIHGGPHVMWSRHSATMWHEWQTLAARGYVVLATNPRGSDGYGRDFRAALIGRWGEADLPDLLAGVEEVIALGYADPERLVITGGSYGGFMTAWVISHDQRFKAAVAQRGVYDLISFYSTSDIPLLTEWEFAANPWQHSELLWRFSPLAHVENIHTPLLLLHSENDFRAPIPSAEGIFVALRRLNRSVQMVRYPRDGHELSRSGEPKHRIDRLQRIAGWFDRHVKE